MQNEILEKALGYLRVGFSVIPQTKDKKPLIEWKEFQTRLPTAEEVHEWWKQWPDANVAIVTGKISGITVVDVEKGGDISKFPKTLTIKSGGGGWHLYYQYHQMSSYNRILELTDVKSDGGLVTAPPSVHASGQKYETVTRMAQQPFPADLFAKPLKEKAEAKDFSKLFSEVVEKGGRNDTLTAVAGKFLRHFPEKQWDMAWEALQSWNETHADPPVSQQELKNIYNSIAKTEERRRMTGDDVGEANLIEQDEDRYIVHVPIVDGFIVFEFTDPDRSSRSIDVAVRCSVEIPGRESKAFVQRMNILSNSARESFVRQLKEAFIGTKIGWGLALSQACEVLESTLRQSSEVHTFTDELFPETQYLIRPFIADEGTTIIFGDGGTGKTYITLRMAVSLATNTPFLGVEPSKEVNTLFVDYESTHSNWSSRVTKLLNGIAGLMPQDREKAKERLFYFAPQTAIKDAKYELLKTIREKKIGLVIIDSAVSACGGEPENAGIAAQMFNTMVRLGVPVLLIAHETKDTNGKNKKPFGSTFWHNFARNTWNVSKDQDLGDSAIHVGLFHRKCNNDRLYPPRSARIYFGDNMVDINPENNSRWSSELSLKDKILNELAEKSMSAKELSESVGVPIGQVKVRLAELKHGKGLVENNDGIWGLKKPENEATSE